MFKQGRRLPVGYEVADPSLTIVEVEDAQGCLLAESCYEDAFGRFHLETVLWIRLQHPIFCDWESRSFADVKLHRMNGRNFVVQDTESGKLIPHPSSEPYFVVFLSEEDYRDLKGAIQSGDMAPSGVGWPQDQRTPGFLIR